MKSKSDRERERERGHRSVLMVPSRRKCQPSSWEPAKPKIKEPGHEGQADLRK